VGREIPDALVDFIFPGAERLVTRNAQDIGLPIRELETSYKLVGLRPFVTYQSPYPADVGVRD
jgi:hypothetical protein